MEYKIIFIVTCVVIFFSGWLIGKMSHKSDGIIRIEANEDGTRDVIRFILDFDLDWVRSQKTILFKVEDLSKKTQSL